MSSVYFIIISLSWLFILLMMTYWRGQNGWEMRATSSKCLHAEPLPRPSLEFLWFCATHHLPLQPLAVLFIWSSATCFPYCLTTSYLLYAIDFLEAAVTQFWVAPILNAAFKIIQDRWGRFSESWQINTWLGATKDNKNQRAAARKYTPTGKRQKWKIFET